MTPTQIAAVAILAILAVSMAAVTIAHTVQAFRDDAEAEERARLIAEYERLHEGLGTRDDD